MCRNVVCLAAAQRFIGGLHPSGAETHGFRLPTAVIAREVAEEVYVKGASRRCGWSEYEVVFMPVTPTELYCSPKRHDLAAAARRRLRRTGQALPPQGDTLHSPDSPGNRFQTRAGGHFESRVSRARLVLFSKVKTANERTRHSQTAD